MEVGKIYELSVTIEPYIMYYLVHLLHIQRHKTFSSVTWEVFHDGEAPRIEHTIIFPSDELNAKEIPHLDWILAKMKNVWYH